MTADVIAWLESVGVPVEFVARLHPALLHLPIGLLAAAVATELLAWWRRDEGSERARRVCLWATLGSAGLAATTGWFLAEVDGATGGTVTWHRWAAVAMSVVLVLVVFVDQRGHAVRRRVLLCMASLLALLTGHLGGSLTHGAQYLPSVAPEPVRRVLDVVDGWHRDADVDVSADAPALDQGDVWTVLANHCHRCHGAEVQKGRLRLDTVDGIESVIVAGSAPDSELFRRVTLARDHDDAMPPDDEPLADGQVLALMTWINAGAPLADIERERQAQEDQDAALGASLDAVRRASGASVVALTGDPRGPLRVDRSLTAAAPTREQLASLAPIAGRVVELSLAGNVCADVFDALPTFPLLERVDASKTDLGDLHVSALLASSLGVTSLNLYGTRVTEALLTSAGNLASLKRLVLHDTAIDAATLTAFSARHPHVSVTGTLALPDDPFEDAGPRRVLAADASTGKIALLRETAIGHFDTLWEHAIRDIHDLHVLENGHVLFQDTWTKLLEVDPATGDVMWSYNASTTNRNSADERVEIHAFQRLDDGVTMIAESGPARIIEVSREGALLRAVPLTVDRPDAHHDTRLVRKTDAGTYLVAHENDGVVREYNANGEVIWSYDVPLFEREPKPGSGFDGWGDAVFGALRLPSGNTLIATGNGHSVIEVDPVGDVVWHLAQDDIPDVRLAWVTTIQRLTNGNLLIGNCHAGPDQPQLIEITRDKELVWMFRDHERFGNALSNAFVIEDPLRDG